MDWPHWGGIISGVVAMVIAVVGWYSSRQKNEATAISELTDSISTLNRERREDRAHFEQELSAMQMKYSAEIKALATRVSDLEHENHRLLQENHNLRQLINGRRERGEG